MHRYALGINGKTDSQDVNSEDIGKDSLVEMIQDEENGKVCHHSPVRVCLKM
jgi:hypothetical protein